MHIHIYMNSDTSPNSPQPTCSAICLDFATVDCEFSRTLYLMVQRRRLDPVLDFPIKH